MTVDSPIGPLTLVNTDGVLSALLMARRSRGRDRSLLGTNTPAGFEQVVEQVSEYFARERTEFTVPFAGDGSAFERRVWRELTRIPYGTTRSYAEVAEALGDRTLAQAVGAANGRNPIAVVVPCHRVIGADGSLTGYAGGLERKAYLLALENPARAIQPPLFAL